jgi:hypothetical protein
MRIIRYRPQFLGRDSGIVNAGRGGPQQWLGSRIDALAAKIDEHLGRHTG